MPQNAKTRSQPHSQISQVKIIEGFNNFPISWLNKQGYCEYGIYLENVKGVEVRPSNAMIEGTRVHNKLEMDFREEAEPATLDEMLETSKKAEILSRELPVLSVRYGIRGFIDEIWMNPNEFIIIDDKPGNRAFKSSINQVYGYCLAFQDTVQEKRDIVASIRERGTENIFWSAYFDEKAQEDIKNLVNRIHKLLLGEEEYIPTKNSKKCRSCRLNRMCDRQAGL